MVAALAISLSFYDVLFHVSILFKAFSHWSSANITLSILELTSLVSNITLNTAQNGFFSSVCSENRRAAFASIFGRNSKHWIVSGSSLSVHTDDRIGLF